MSRVLTAAFDIFFVLMQIDPRQIVEESQRRTMTQSQHYEGTLEVIDAKSKITEKRWQYDRIGSHGSSKSVLRFTAPAEVKGVALLVINHPISGCGHPRSTGSGGLHCKTVPPDFSERILASKTWKNETRTSSITDCSATKP